MKTLQQIKEELLNRGFMATIPANANYVSVMGYNKKYFKAKKAKADTIVTALISKGYNAKTEKHIDGFYDFYVYA